MKFQFEVKGRAALREAIEAEWWTRRRARVKAKRIALEVTSGN